TLTRKPLRVIAFSRGSFMALADTRLTDPTAEEVVTALRAAVKTVNGKKRKDILWLSDSTYQTLGERVENEREGQFRQSDPSERTEVDQLLLAWWTNAAGRKLVRVRSWHDRNRRGRHRWPDSSLALEVRFREEVSDRENRPAVWHVDYERVLEVSTD